jgi:hypothetical protein
MRTAGENKDQLKIQKEKYKYFSLFFFDFTSLIFVWVDCAHILLQGQGKSKYCDATG